MKPNFCFSTGCRVLALGTLLAFVLPVQAQDQPDEADAAPDAATATAKKPGSRFPLIEAAGIVLTPDEKKQIMTFRRGAAARQKEVRDDAKMSKADKTSAHKQITEALKQHTLDALTPEHRAQYQAYYGVKTANGPVTTTGNAALAPQALAPIDNGPVATDNTSNGNAMDNGGGNANNDGNDNGDNNGAIAGTTPIDNAPRGFSSAQPWDGNQQNNMSSQEQQLALALNRRNARVHRHSVNKALKAAAPRRATGSTPQTGVVFQTAKRGRTVNLGRPRPGSATITQGRTIRTKVKKK